MRTIAWGAAACALCISAAAPLSAAEAPEIRLVLQITVDQLRGDLPQKVLDRVEDGGFRYLYEHGTVYLDAHHRHANTETIVGHTTLATGADPSAHGMIGNVWFDRKTGALVYNIEDPSERLLTVGADVDARREIDPTQKTATTEGRSPRAIEVSTFSDELAVFTAGRAKVFGVSVKDRGAVSMAGHAGIAYWFSKAAGEFVTSTYYADAYPEWVSEWNGKRLPFENAETAWTLLHEKSTYTFADADDQPWETDIAGFGRTFPHSFGQAENPYFTTLLTLSPVGDGVGRHARLSQRQLLVDRLRGPYLRAFQLRDGGQSPSPRSFACRPSFVCRRERRSGPHPGGSIR